MGSGFIAADTRRMSDMIVAIDPRSNRSAGGRGDMQINQIPAGLFVPVAIQVFDDNPIFRADDEARRGGFDPGRAMRRSLHDR